MASSFNPRTPCGVRPWDGSISFVALGVSIHALLAECDGGFQRFGGAAGRFQSTHSLRSATALEDLEMINVWVSIHALLAECDQVFKGGGNRPGVSIHALLAECDVYSRVPSPVPRSFNPRTPCGVRQAKTTKRKETIMFQSTHSLRSATGLANHFRYLHPVSIHALLAECDPPGVQTFWQSPCFNPRTPCGVRLAYSQITRTGETFQSTHSLRSATATIVFPDLNNKVSIHALLAECDITPLAPSFRS